ncbi:pseudouridine synthase [Sphaerotilus sp.]|uniref:pseudouridine synthase n=1 Tax=Sphaerotilus sp. TaxID=2093942 RepID=UPI003DA7BC64
MTLSHALFTQGFGTRRDCDGLVLNGLVSIAGRVTDDPDEAVSPEGLVLNVEGRDWPWREFAVVMLNKPTGYECSQKPKHWPSVMTLLPPPLRWRSGGDVQPVGRLDQDTTGVLLLTDDGALIHKLTHPKKHVDKVYEITCARPVTDEQVQQLRAGVVLNDDPQPVRSEECAATGEFTLRMMLTEGKYHQVKRMVAAVGNHVESLHRRSFGRITIPDGLAPGQWCWIDPQDI